MAITAEQGGTMTKPEVAKGARFEKVTPWV